MIIQVRNFKSIVGIKLQRILFLAIADIVNIWQLFNFGMGFMAARQTLYLERIEC